jgi:hypothetical protein
VQCYAMVGGLEAAWLGGSLALPQSAATKALNHSERLAPTASGAYFGIAGWNTFREIFWRLSIRAAVIRPRGRGKKRRGVLPRRKTLETNGAPGLWINPQPQRNDE